MVLQIDSNRECGGHPGGCGDFVRHPAGLPPKRSQRLPGVSGHRTDADVGEFVSSRMTVEVVLAPRNQTDLEDQLAGVYRSGSPSYHQWLQSGEFYSRYAPDASQVAAVVSHLSASGLTVEPSSSPFLVRASGPSSLVASAFRDTAAQLPQS